MVPRALRKSIARLRLRHKLAVLLSFAALLPVGVVSYLAVDVVLRNLDRSLGDETERQLQVGLSLVLRHIDRIEDDASRLARGSELAAVMAAGPLAGGQGQTIAGVLERDSAYSTAALVQIFDRHGRQIAQSMAGNAPAEFTGFAVPADSRPARAALAFESPLTVEPVGRVLVVRAAAPIVDRSYRRLGAVVVSSPLDRPFIDEIKSALGTDVMIFAAGPRGEVSGDTGFLPDFFHTAIATFVDDTGVRKEDVDLRPAIARRLAHARSVLTSQLIDGREHEVGYTLLLDSEHEPVGVLAVAVNRAPLVMATSAATRSLVLGAAGAFLFALALAALLSRRLTRPIARLHRGALAVARGDLEQRFALDDENLTSGDAASEGDEIGELAAAFSHMTRALKENQQRLAARVRELESLHGAGRAVSAVIDLRQVLPTIVDSVASVFEVPMCGLWLTRVPLKEHGPDSHPVELDLEIAAVRVKPVPRGQSGPGGQGGEPDIEPLIETDNKADIKADIEPGIEPGIGASKNGVPQVQSDELTQRGPALAMPLLPIASDVAQKRGTLRIDCALDDPRYRDAAVRAGVTGSLLATPLERKGSVIGVLIVGRTDEGKPFTAADSNLLDTFAGQAASAVENARLYEEVRAFNEELEGMVKSRTAELTHANAELARIITELGETQSQLILSERLAGLGLLVAGVAHEINSPSAAIAGSVKALVDNVARLTGHLRRLASLALPPGLSAAYTEAVADRAGPLAAAPMPSAVAVRRAGRALQAFLASRGLADSEARIAARRLAEVGVAIEAPGEAPGDASGGADLAEPLADLVGDIPDGQRDEAICALTGYLVDSVFLHRNALTIRSSIGRIQRIVGALKTYSHLDQEARQVATDLHEGIENTLVLLHYVLRDITIIKKYQPLPKVPAFVDELNQVWTNLIHNAAQALQGQGEITIATGTRDEGVYGRIIDSGPGIAEEIVPRIFEPFFTTKPKGEGTGLGLGIVRQIVDKHGGKVTCNSRPGRTCFEVWLPLAQPARLDDSASQFAEDVGKVAP